MVKKKIMDAWHQMLSEAKKFDENSSHLIGVFLLDIDSFQFINDTLGQDTGDFLLSEVANQLKTVCDPVGAKTIRMDDHEFLLLYSGINERDIYEFSERILQQFTMPFSIKGSNYRVTTSFGISLYPEHSESLDTLIKQADMALYRAKKRRNQFILFHPEMNKNSLERTSVENDFFEE